MKPELEASYAGTAWQPVVEDMVKDAKNFTPDEHFSIVLSSRKSRLASEDRLRLYLFGALRIIKQVQVQVPIDITFRLPPTTLQVRVLTGPRASFPRLGFHSILVKRYFAWTLRNSLSNSCHLPSPWHLM